MQASVALGLAVPRSAKTTVTSLGLVGLTEMLAADDRPWGVAQPVFQLHGRDGCAEGLAAVGRLGDHDLVVEVEVDLPSGLVLPVQEMHIQVAIGGHFGD